MPSTSWRRMWESEKEKIKKVKCKKRKKNENKNKREEEARNEGKEKKVSHDHKVNFEICSYAAPCQWLWVSRIMLFPALFGSCLMAGFRKTFSRDMGDRARQSLSRVLLLFWPRLCARSRTSISFFHIVLGRTLLCIEKHDFIYADWAVDGISAGARMHLEESPIIIWVLLRIRLSCSMKIESVKDTQDTFFWCSVRESRNVRGEKREEEEKSNNNQTVDKPIRLLHVLM